MIYFSRLFKKLSSKISIASQGEKTTISNMEEKIIIDKLISAVKKCHGSDTSICAAFKLAEDYGITKAFEVMVNALKYEGDIEKLHAITYALSSVMYRFLKEDNIAFQNPSKHAEMLLPHLNQKKYEARCDVVRILGIIGDPIAIDSLSIIVKSDDGEHVRMAAAYALKEIGTPKAISILEMVLKEDGKLRKSSDIKKQ